MLNTDFFISFRSAKNEINDSKEFSDAVCDKDLALDLEVQQALAKKTNGRIQQDDLTSHLAR